MGDVCASHSWLRGSVWFPVRNESPGSHHASILSSDLADDLTAACGFFIQARQPLLI
jgi:hypothetical protein